MNKQSGPSTDVVIIGAGVIGLLSARVLAANGRRVTVLDKGSFGSESSWAGGGILSPLCPWRVPEAISALCRWSQLEYPGLASALLEATGIDPEWIRSGLLIWSGNETARAIEWLQREQTEHRLLAADGVRGLEPHLSFASGDVLEIPGIAQVRNPRFLRALRASLQPPGVTILEDRPVTDLLIEGGRVTAAITGGEQHRGECFVLAAGAWSGRFASRWLPGLDVAPVKGQMLAFQADPDWLSHIVLRDERYLIPRRGGVILAGSTVEHAAFDKATTESARRQLEEFARSTLPELAHAPVLRHWAGLRPGSPTGVPYVGRHPEVPNLFFNCGHFRNGFVMAPASARLLGDLVLGRPPLVPPEPYAYEAPR